LDAREKVAVVAELVGTRDRSDERALCAMATCPMHENFGALGLTVDVQLDAIDHLPYDSLLLCDCRSGGAPERRNVGSQATDALTLVSRERCWLLRHEPSMLFLEFALFEETLFELVLDRARDEAILRFHGVVLPHCPVDVVLSSFKPLFPRLIQSLALCFDVFRYLQADLERGGLERFEHKRCDAIINNPRRD
jgi:hypothetical protein